jgi:hypothetical protein
MFENSNAKLIVQVLQAENLKLMESNDYLAAMNILEAIVWLQNILTSNPLQETNEEETNEDSECQKVNQAYQTAFHFPNTSSSETESKTTTEDNEKPKVIKLPKTKRTEATKRKEWILETIENYKGGISEQQVKSLYISSTQINHTESELKKDKPNDKEVRGCALCSRYIDTLIEDGKIYLNSKNLLVAN